MKRAVWVFFGLFVIFPSGMATLYAGDMEAKINLQEDAFTVLNGSSTAVARFKGDGQIGIGTTTPAVRLHVVGTATAIIGSLGIGTTTPATELQVIGTVTANRFAITNSVFIADSVGSLTASTITSKGTITAAGNLVVNTDTLYVDSVNGRVGIGTTVPDVKFQVSGQAKASSFSSSGDGTAGLPSYRFESDADVGMWRPTTNSLAFSTGGAERIRIDSSGRVGIGTTTPAQLLDVDGNVAVSGVTVHTSDIRLKKNIAVIKGALERVSRLHGVGFRWIDKERDLEQGAQLGVIAQEVESVFPELVLTDSNGYKSVAYSNLVAPLIESVKELKAKIEAEGAENEKLMAKIVKLNTQNEELKTKDDELMAAISQLASEIAELKVITINN